MSAPAAIQGTYTDLKIVRSRKVCQIVVEIPLEASQGFVEAFGMPNPEAETWVAIARLKAGVAQATGEHRERRRFTELPRSQQAAMACNDPSFQVFVKEDIGGPVIGKTEYAAAECVRDYCDVQSRAHLDTNPQAGRLWDELYGRYQAWRLAA